MRSWLLPCALAGLLGLQCGAAALPQVEDTVAPALSLQRLLLETEGTTLKEGPPANAVSKCVCQSQGCQSGCSIGEKSAAALGKPVLPDTPSYPPNLPHQPDHPRMPVTLPPSQPRYYPARVLDSNQKGLFEEAISPSRLKEAPRQAKAYPRRAKLKACPHCLAAAAAAVQQQRRLEEKPPPDVPAPGSYSAPTAPSPLPDPGEETEAPGGNGPEEGPPPEGEGPPPEDENVEGPTAEINGVAGGDDTSDTPSPAPVPDGTEFDSSQGTDDEPPSPPLKNNSPTCGDGSNDPDCSAHVSEPPAPSPDADPPDEEPPEVPLSPEAEPVNPVPPPDDPPPDDPPADDPAADDPPADDPPESDPPEADPPAVPDPPVAPDPEPPVTDPPPEPPAPDTPDKTPPAPDPPAVDPPPEPPAPDTPVDTPPAPDTPGPDSPPEPPAPDAPGNTPPAPDAPATDAPPAPPAPDTPDTPDNVTLAPGPPAPDAPQAGLPPGPSGPPGSPPEKPPTLLSPPTPSVEAVPETPPAPDLPPAVKPDTVTTPPPEDLPPPVTLEPPKAPPKQTPPPPLIEASPPPPTPPPPPCTGDDQPVECRNQYQPTLPSPDDSEGEGKTGTAAIGIGMTSTTGNTGWAPKGTESVSGIIVVFAVALFGLAIIFVVGGSALYVVHRKKRQSHMFDFSHSIGGSAYQIPWNTPFAGQYDVGLSRPTSAGASTLQTVSRAPQVGPPMQSMSSAFSGGTHDGVEGVYEYHGSGAFQAAASGGVPQVPFGYGHSPGPSGLQVQSSAYTSAGSGAYAASGVYSGPNGAAIMSGPASKPRPNWMKAMAPTEELKQGSMALQSVAAGHSPHDPTDDTISIQLDTSPSPAQQMRPTCAADDTGGLAAATDDLVSVAQLGIGASSMDVGSHQSNEQSLQGVSVRRVAQGERAVHNIMSTPKPVSGRKVLRSRQKSDETPGRAEAQGGLATVAEGAAQCTPEAEETQARASASGVVGSEGATPPVPTSEGSAAATAVTANGGTALGPASEGSPAQSAVSANAGTVRALGSEGAPTAGTRNGTGAIARSVTNSERVNALANLVVMRED